MTHTLVTWLAWSFIGFAGICFGNYIHHLEENSFTPRQNTQVSLFFFLCYVLSALRIAAVI